MNYLVDTNVLSELAKPLPADGVLYQADEIIVVFANAL